MSRRLVLAAALGLAAWPARAWVRSTTASGLCLWWSTRQVHYSVNDFSVNPAQSVCSSSPAPPAGPGSVGAALAAVKASFTTWTDAGGCTDIQTVQDGTTPFTGTGFDCQNLVVFRRGLCAGLVPPGDACHLWDVNAGATVNCADKWNCWDTDDPFHADSRIIALTTVSYSDGTGEILDADMELNAWTGSGPEPPGYYFTCLNPPLPVCAAPGDGSCIDVDVQNVVTHEAGHALGMGHTQPTNCVPYVAEVNAATMCDSAPPGETDKRTLAPDDIAGICAIYPPGPATNTGPQPGVCNGSGLVALRPSSTCDRASGCGCGTAGADGWLGLLAPLLWRRRARRAQPRRSGQYTTAPAYPTTESSPAPASALLP